MDSIRANLGFSECARTLPLAGMIPTDRYDVSRLSRDRAMSDSMYFTQITVPQLAYIGRRDL
jgi:hypothetical protein